MARLTGIRICNFKAVGDKPIELRLAPITLLYGPNGAGKSSILHALHYAREILERGNVDPDRTLSGGALDLGGFRNLVHRRDLHRTIVLGFDLDVHDMGVEWFDALNEMGFSIDPGPLIPADQIDRASVDLTISWSPFFEKPFVERCSIGLLDRPFATIASTRDGANVELENIDFDHPVLNQEVDYDAPDWNIRPLLFGDKRTERVGVFGLSQALPRLDEPLHLDLEGETIRLAGELLDDTEERAAIRERRALMDYMSALIVGPLQQLRDALRSFVHIGPLREVPPRGYKAQTSPDASRWWNGLAAWDRLAEMGIGGVDEVDLWLSERLKSGFGIKVDHLRAVPTESELGAILRRGVTLDDLEAIAAEWSKLPEEARVVLVDQNSQLDVQPWDVGVGISQILPIVVAAVDGGVARFLAVEQPELHVHPRLQTELGDLVAATAAPAGEQPSLFEGHPSTLVPNGRTLLVETHSEHLVLRLLRRIRERHEDNASPDAPVVSSELLSVNYLQPGEKGVRLHHLRVDETGEFIDRWPEGFFAEREDELF